jgi:hypothetical protein
MTPPTRLALASQALLLLYLQVIEWVDLYPWNDVRRGNGQEVLDVLLGAFMGMALVATARRWRSGLVIAALGYAVWMYLQVVTFWVPYATGASARWQRIHAAHFAQTIQWLPSWDDHLPPDASHFVLQLLLLFALGATVASARGAFVGRGTRAEPA